MNGISFDIRKNDIVTSLNYGQTIISSAKVHSYDWTEDKNKAWIAKITGICPEWGYKREFARAAYMAKQKLEVGTLQKLVWNLDPNSIYEYRNLMVDPLQNLTTDGYFIALNNGLVEIEKEQVRGYLNMPVKKKKLIEEIDRKNPRFTADDIPF